MDNLTLKAFENLLLRIRQGEQIHRNEFDAFLFLNNARDRLYVNWKLADAFFDSGNKKNLSLAKETIEKAWLLSGFSSEEVFASYHRINLALNDIPAIKQAYKRLGIYFAQNGEIGKAVDYFNQWQYVYASVLNLDAYEYDLDILNAIEQAAVPYRFEKYPAPDFNGKIRVAYLLKGMSENNSVLIKINALLAKYHDREKFDIEFFVPETSEACAQIPSCRENVLKFERLGFKINFAENHPDKFNTLYSVAKKIYDFNPHVMVLSAALSLFEHYFISALKPARLQICLNQGPVAQFSWFNCEYAVSWFKTNVTECPIDTEIVPLEFEFEKINELQPKKRAELGIPEDAVIMASAGRMVKFRAQKFWETIMSALRENPKLYYIVLGFTLEQFPALSTLIPQELAERIKFFPWSGNYLDYLSVADFVLDSYPTGGGVVMMDSMALGKPILSFHHDFFKINDGSFGSASDDVLPFEELKIERDNFDELLEKIISLADDAGQRKRLGELCRNHVLQNFSSPERMTRRCEKIYAEQIIKQLRKTE